MEKFTASNGLVLVPKSDGSVRWEGGNDAAYVTKALREFFRHERDAELGRWRRPEWPLYVCKALDDNRVKIFHERSFTHAVWDRSDLENGRDDWGRDSAKEYFAAHPVPRPWHDAKPGEVWAVTWDSQESACVVEECEISKNGLAFNDGTRAILGTQAPAITAGRRIWPVVE